VGIQKRKICGVLSILFIILLSSPTSLGRIIYVDAEATFTNDGSSWADAFLCLQDALADVQAGDEIRVANGIYKPDQKVVTTSREIQIRSSRDRTATFQLKNGVTIKGGYAGFSEPNPDTRDIFVYKTILSGDLNGDDGPNSTNNSENSFHVVTGSNTNITAKLNGVTITAGSVGGVYNSSGNPTISNCIFRENSARAGGGMQNSNGSNPIITNCNFVCNMATEEGGGMRNFESAPRLTSCTFTENSVELKYGGGMRNYKSSPILINCIFIGNSGAGQGGGVFNHNNSHPILVNCVFSGNIADAGGGLSNVYGSHPALINCTFSKNQANAAGEVESTMSTIADQD
jgi:hypothetical protein